MPADISQALQEANLFLNGGETRESDDSPMRLYSFRKDSSLIFAAFRQTHGVNLVTDQLHWWVFLALFMDLGQDTTFCQLVGLRKRLRTGKATKEEREAAREMGDLIDTPLVDDRTLEEKEALAVFERKEAERKAREAESQFLKEVEEQRNRNGH